MKHHCLAILTILLLTQCAVSLSLAETTGQAPSAASIASQGDLPGARSEDGTPQMLAPPEVWSAYDPDAGALDEEVVKCWTTKAAAYKEVYFSAYIDGQTVRVYGIYASPLQTPKPGARVPAVMHLHGGGQTVNEQWLEAWTARGYAALTCNYHGVWEQRDRFTIYPEALKHGNHMYLAGKEMATSPSVRASSWYIWSAVARRALTYLREQPEVDRERIGAFGISMGGTTAWSFAMDPRLKAACAIYGCGWNRYYRKIPRFDPSATMPEMTPDDRVWLAGMAPEACAPFVKCPMLFLSSSNDTHGNMDRAYETLARLPAGLEHRAAFTPRFCHHIGADFKDDLFLWMDTWLKGGPGWPKSPLAKVSLGADGVPVLTITADRVAEVEKVDAYYAVTNPRPMSRNWRSVATRPSADGWQAVLPVLDTNAYLFAFANVRYKTGVDVSSNEEAVIPLALGPARATDAVSSVLFDGTEGTGMWATNSPCVDPVPPEEIPVPVRPAIGPEGKSGFTTLYWTSPITYQPGDPKWRAPETAGLSFQVATTKGEKFTVVFYEDYAWSGQRTYEASVTLQGQAGWQTVTLFPSDFREKKTGDVPGEAPATFARCQTLELVGPWKDQKIVFTDIRWVLPQSELSAEPSAAKPAPGDADFPTENKTARHKEKVAAVKAGNYDLVLIGDSITHAMGDMNDGKYAPNQAVWTRYFAPRNAINLGMNGQRTENILWNLQHGQLDFARSPKLAVLLVGTNNTDDRHFARVHTPEEIFRGTKAIVDLIRQRHPTTKILILRIFPRGGDNEKGVSPPAFNSSAKCIETCRLAGALTAKLADDKQVFWLDINQIFLNRDSTINTDLMWDLLHPSAPAGAEAWAKAIEPTVAKLLGEKPAAGVQREADTTAVAEDASTPKLAFRRAASELHFDTGVLKGTLGEGGKSVGLRPVTYVASSIQMAGPLGILSPYRMLTSEDRFGTAAWDWASKSEVLADGAARVHWSPDKEHPLEMTGIYRWSATDTLDLELTVKPQRNLPHFELFVASYFNGFPTSLACVRQGDLADGACRFMQAEKKAGDWQTFPRDDAAARLFGDGRWNHPPHPVTWQIRPRFAEPLALRRDAKSGLTAVLMSQPKDCFGVSMPYGEEEHRSIYFSLFGSDLKAGEAVSANIRLVIGKDITEDRALELYRAYRHIPARVRE